ncbi:MAG: cob(I)yrinic acid a,c-diamide adenosyltransferase [Bacillota bacterium]
MKIYTKTGDKGETGLFGGGRVSKDNLRIEAYGTIDELNSVIGVAIAELENGEVKELLQSIQNQLFIAGSDLAAPRTEKNEQYIQRVDRSFGESIEKAIDEFDSRLEELRNFILPGGSKGAAYLHLARTVCRRGERIATALNKSVEIGHDLMVYLNRLSDLLFVLARYVNHVQNIPDIIWKKP